MSTSVIPVHVALVDQTGEVKLSDLQTLARDLNDQVQRDFAPIWNVKASIGAYETAPAAMWTLYIQKQLDQPGALGYHTDTTTNQPVAYCEYSPPGPNGYSVTVSHELLEMLADPYGNRMHGSILPEGIQPEQVGLNNPGEQVQYLLEVADPCEETSYLIGNSYVSDFLLPGWYYTSPQKGIAYSHQGGCTAPRQVADGGYVSFSNAKNEWYQVFNEGGNLSVSDLGNFNASEGRSLREWVDLKAREHRMNKA